MTALRCNVCGREMDHVPTRIPYGWTWRCPDEGFLRHVEQEKGGAS